MMKRPESLIASDDGKLSFTVRMEGDAVQVVRKQCVEGRGRFTLVLQLRTINELACLLDADELRFSYPGIYVRMRRSIAAHLLAWDSINP